MQSAAAPGRRLVLSLPSPHRAKLSVLLVKASGRVIYYHPQTMLLKVPAEKLAGRRLRAGKIREQSDKEEIKETGPPGPARLLVLIYSRAKDQTGAHVG